jgi:hypothetical protein
VARKRKADSGRPEANHEIRERHEKNLELKAGALQQSGKRKGETSWPQKVAKGAKFTMKGMKGMKRNLTAEN